MKRIVAFCLTLILLLSIALTSLTVSAADFECAVDPVSSNVYVENLDTGVVVYEKNSDEKVYPASLTKMMTYIVVTENVYDLENTKVKVTADMLANLDPASSVMGLSGYTGQEFTVLELLYGLMLPSGNDAALVLANFVGDGTVENFIEMMNRKAGQLGCKGTHFVNPHGLFDINHYSTAKDLAIIAKYAAEKPYFKEITGTATYQVSSMNEPLENTNYMLNASYPQYYYQYVNAGKTGYTDEAGKCLVTFATKDGYNYLCVTLGAPFSYAENVNYAMYDTKDLYNWAFDNISMVEVLSASTVVRTLSVEFAWGDVKADIMPRVPVQALLPNDYDKSQVKTSVELKKDTVRAPVKVGDPVGLIKVYYKDEFVGSTELVCGRFVEGEEILKDTEIKLNKMNYNMHRFIGFVVKNIIWLSIVTALLIIYIVYKISTYRKMKRRRARHRYR